MWGTDMHDVMKSDQSLVISYRTLRKIVGILGLTFPFVLYIGSSIFDDGGIQRSISSYYHTGMRDVFVGTLCVIGFFLLSYRGHERKDDYAGDVACASALGIAFFPTAKDGQISGMAVILDHIHLAFAALFFASLIYFSLALFTKTNPAVNLTRRKQLRNRVYRTCGFTMLTCISLILLYRLAPPAVVAALEFLRPVYWLEAFAIAAFGVSWLTKGRAILNNKPDD